MNIPEETILPFIRHPVARLNGKNLILLGTDRNNMVEARNPIENYPLPWEMSKLFRNAKAVWTSLDYESPKPEDIAVSFATAGMGFNENKCLYGKMNQRRFALSQPNRSATTNNVSRPILNALISAINK